MRAPSLRSPSFRLSSVVRLAVVLALRRWATAAGVSVRTLQIGVAVGVPALAAGSAALSGWLGRKGVVAELGLPPLGVAALVLLGSVFTAGLVAIVAAYQSAHSVALPQTLLGLPSTNREVGTALAAVPGVVAAVKLVVLLPLCAGLIAQDASVPWWRAALAFTAAELVGASAGRTLYTVTGALLRRCRIVLAANLAALALWCGVAALMLAAFRELLGSLDAIDASSWEAWTGWPMLLGAVSGSTSGIVPAVALAASALTLDVLALGLTAQALVVRTSAREPRWLLLSQRARWPLFQVAVLRLLRNPATRNQSIANTVMLLAIVAAAVLLRLPDRSAFAPTGVRGSAFFAAQTAIASRGLWSRSFPHELLIGAALPAWVLGIWSASLAVALVTVAPFAAFYAVWADDPRLLGATLALTVFTVSVGCLFSFVVVPGAELSSSLTLGAFLVLLGTAAGSWFVTRVFSIDDFLPGLGLMALLSLLIPPALVAIERRRFAAGAVVVFHPSDSTRSSS